MEHCGLLAQVSKAALANVCNRGFYSTYLSPKSGKCRKNKLSQILPDIPYQTSMKPQHISPPSLARSSAAKLVKGKGTSIKTRSNKLLSLHLVIRLQKRCVCKSFRLRICVKIWNQTFRRKHLEKRDSYDLELDHDIEWDDEVEESVSANDGDLAGKLSFLLTEMSPI